MKGESQRQASCSHVKCQRYPGKTSLSRNSATATAAAATESLGPSAEKNPICIFVLVQLDEGRK